ncbi:hypothetical protein RF11_12460 [Thelohanellus kitauei]|uniref:Uncharacterized protein n=1 Tax=Thelohanellus kitauei TaxID=669202 RepID=A0A0C2N0D6_THEKT|nr:hypothetical protein RF11_12460 [Thelohanellus kitauei]
MANLAMVEDSYLVTLRIARATTPQNIDEEQLFPSAKYMVQQLGVLVSSKEPQKEGITVEILKKGAETLEPDVYTVTLIYNNHGLFYKVNSQGLSRWNSTNTIEGE